jgi:phosphatidylserine/phosphatidylglycerophosphate/cardiolipin synthase-like enzyme
MRKKVDDGKGLVVQAVAGTYVVMLNIDYPKAKCDGLLGFAIHRTDHTEDEAYYLTGVKVFESVPRDAPLGAQFSTRKHPIQDFQWSDFSAKPGHKYTYRVIALDGEPEDPQEKAQVEVTVETESEQSGKHDVFFNRGAAASQEYARRFRNQSPAKAGEEAFRWLSRGLHEALIGFIERAEDETFGLRVAAYEFTEDSVLEALHDAAKKRGADVQIVYHAREGVSEKEDRDGNPVKTQTGRNRDAATRAGIKDLCTERMAKPASAISHNKFIVLLKNDKPVAVLTGSTNFSQGGIFGHSNVVQVVDDEKVARKYLQYWERLLEDPKKKDLAEALSGELNMPEDLPEKGSTCVFSPRRSTDALECYCRLASQAKDAIFVTLAFGMNQLLHDVFENGKAPLRFGLMEKMAVTTGDAERDDAAQAKVVALRKMPENRIGVGSFLKQNMFDQWMEEKLTGLNVHVRFLHTKFMLLDPMSDSPIVVTGSANFSNASCVTNDENMLIIHGDTRVADIYLGEFMRLYRHYSFRDFVSSGAAERQEVTPQFLDEDNKWWRKYFGNTPQSRLRAYLVS